MKTLNYMSDGDGRKCLKLRLMVGSWYRKPIRERAGTKITRTALDWLKQNRIRPDVIFVDACNVKGIIRVLSLYKPVIAHPTALFGITLFNIPERVAPKELAPTKINYKLRNMVTCRGGICLQLSEISRYTGISIRSVAFYGKKGYNDYVFKHEGSFPS